MSTDKTDKSPQEQHYTLEVHDVDNDDETTDPTEEVDNDGQTDEHR